jgi:membrane associated rhomboid family serine protease
MMIVWILEAFAARTMDLDIVEWLFSFESVYQVSPGWILSPLAHSLTDPLHIGSNITLLIVYGGLSEQHLRDREFLFMFFFIGIISHPVFHLTFSNASNVLGASAAVAGFVMFGVNHYARSHEMHIYDNGETALWNLVGTPIKILVLFIIPIGLVRVTIGQLLGFASRGFTAVEAHASGLFLGYAFSLIIPGVADLPCRNSH